MKSMEEVVEKSCRFIICVIQLQGLISVLMVLSIVANLVNQTEYILLPLHRC